MIYTGLIKKLASCSLVKYFKCFTAAVLHWIRLYFRVIFFSLKSNIFTST